MFYGSSFIQSPRVYEAGVDPLIAMKIVGYTDCKTTAIIYTHVPDETRRIATVNLEEVFGSRGDVAKSLGNAPGFILFWEVAERVEVWYNRVGNDQNGATDCAVNCTEENGET